jgi:hypothetical protein
MHKKVQSGMDLRAFAVLLILGLYAVILVHYWPKTWDDSAITLAFSRNLVRYGDIIPSQFSDRVEGYSSFLWMLVNAIFFSFGLRQDHVLGIAKGLSASLTLINIVLFWNLARHYIRSSVYQLMALSLYVINVRTISSAVFGMETPLYATLVMLSCQLYLNRDKSTAVGVLFALAGSLLILIRHEGILFLLPFVLDTFIRDRKGFLRTPFIYMWICIFLAYQGWHFLYFQEFLTNPMLAKGQWPYRPEFSSLSAVFGYYLFPFVEFALSYISLLTLFSIYLIRTKGEFVFNPAYSAWRVFGWISLSGVLVIILVGGSWDAAARLSYPALPFLLLVFLHFIDRKPFESLVLDSRLATAGLIAGILINVMTVFASFRLPAFSITVTNVRQISQVVSITQSFLRKDRITYAAPDMGGLMLYDGDGKRIVDIGLLCNRRLAKAGYTILDEYVLKAERPEIIEIHDVWAEPFLQSKIFVQMYSPVKVLTPQSQLFFFMRRDIAAELKESPLTNEGSLTGERISPALYDMLLKYGSYDVLDLRNSSLQEGDAANFWD